MNQIIKDKKPSSLRVGDKVRVMDQGLLMMERFRPIGVPPQNIGVVKEIMEDGDLLIEFPIGNDDPNEHSQSAPYPANICRKIS